MTEIGRRDVLAGRFRRFAETLANAAGVDEQHRSVAIGEVLQHHERFGVGDELDESPSVVRRAAVQSCLPPVQQQDGAVCIQQADEASLDV